LLETWRLLFFYAGGVPFFADFRSSIEKLLSSFPRFILDIFSPPTEGPPPPLDPPFPPSVATITDSCSFFPSFLDSERPRVSPFSSRPCFFFLSCRPLLIFPARFPSFLLGKGPRFFENRPSLPTLIRESFLLDGRQGNTVRHLGECFLAQDRGIPSSINPSSPSLRFDSRCIAITPPLFSPWKSPAPIRTFGLLASSCPSDRFRKFPSVNRRREFSFFFDAFLRAFLVFFFLPLFASPPFSSKNVFLSPNFDKRIIFFLLSPIGTSPLQPPQLDSTPPPRFVEDLFFFPPSP